MPGPSARAIVPTRALPTRATLPAATVLISTLLIAGCGGAASPAGAPAPTSPAPTSASSSSAASAHNEQDVAFARDMIVHHASAITMSRLAADRAASGDVRALARRIEQAQEPEIRTMTGWLRDWGEELPDTTGALAGGHGTGGAHGTGGGHSSAAGMDAADLRELAAARGAAFDRRFLELMTEHHRGAVEMARTEQERGQFAPAQQLAGDVIRTQSEEMEEMRGLLARL